MVHSVQQSARRPLRTVAHTVIENRRNTMGLLISTPRLQVERVAQDLAEELVAAGWHFVPKRVWRRNRGTS